jgi:hypothetical protein
MKNKKKEFLRENKTFHAVRLCELFIMKIYFNYKEGNFIHIRK